MTSLKNDSSLSIKWDRSKYKYLHGPIADLGFAIRLRLGKFDNAYKLYLSIITSENYGLKNDVKQGCCIAYLITVQH